MDATTTTTKTPLLEAEGGGWLSKLIAVDEAKEQIRVAVPTIVTSVCFDFIHLVSVMFAGHRAESDLAASILATSWAFVSGFDLMLGLSGALETLCGQAFGAGLYGTLGLYLQASCLITMAFSIAVSILWWYSGSILILLHQDPVIARSAGVYLMYLIPGLFAYGFLQNILRFLQPQSVVLPLFLCSLLPLTLQIAIAYALLRWTTLEFGGAPLASSISLWISVFMLALYVLNTKRFKQTWEGFRMPPWSFLVVNLKLALPSAAMLCLEYWAFEILVLLAGLFPNHEISTSSVAMSVNTEALADTISYGLSAAVSMRVASELGAKSPARARRATAVAFKLMAMLLLIVILSLYIGNDLWACSFSNSPAVINAYSSMTPLLLVSVMFDFLQGILLGVARGCGWQHLVAYMNVGTYYFIGMPAAALLGFKFKLRSKGLWMGLICGQIVQTTGLLLLTKFTNWTSLQIPHDSTTKFVV